MYCRETYMIGLLAIGSNKRLKILMRKKEHFVSFRVSLHTVSVYNHVCSIDL